MNLMLADGNQLIAWLSLVVSIVALLVNWRRSGKTIENSDEALKLSRAKELVNLEWTGSFGGIETRTASGARIMQTGFATAILVNKGRDVFVREAYVESPDRARQWVLRPWTPQGRDVNLSVDPVARGSQLRFRSMTFGTAVDGFDDFKSSRRLVLVTQCGEKRFFDCPTTLGEIIAKAASVPAPADTNAGDTSAS